MRDLQSGTLCGFGSGGSGTQHREAARGLREPAPLGLFSHFPKFKSQECISDPPSVLAVAREDRHKIEKRKPGCLWLQSFASSNKKRAWRAPLQLPACKPGLQADGPGAELEVEALSRDSSGLFPSWSLNSLRCLLATQRNGV